MQLLPHWRRVLTRAWSVWFAASAAALELAPYVLGLDLPGWATGLVIALIALSIGSRLVDQGLGHGGDR